MDCACQAPLSMEYLRQEYWRGFPSPRDLPTQGSNLSLLHWQANSLPLSQQALGRGGETGIWQNLEGYNGAALLHSAGPQGQKQWQTDRHRYPGVFQLVPPPWGSCPAPPRWPFSPKHMVKHPSSQPAPLTEKKCYKWSLWFFEVWGWNSLC